MDNNTATTGTIVYPAPPFQKIAQASRTTGLSQFAIRKGIHDGTVPFIRSGSVFYVNIPRLLEQLNALPAKQR